MELCICWALHILALILQVHDILCNFKCYILMSDCNSNGQSGLRFLFSMAPVYFPQFWLLTPSAVILQPLDAHRYVHTNSCTCAYRHQLLLHCPCSGQFIFQTFKPVPTWKLAATPAWLLWPVPWALGIPEKRLECERKWGISNTFKRRFATPKM